MIDTTRSNSEEQRSIENYVIREIERILGFPLERNVSVQLADNIYINPDFYSNDQTIVGEIYAHVGTLKVGQQRKISQDILKLLLLDKSKDMSYRKIITIVDDTVEKYLKGKSFIAESIRQFGIEIIRINLPDELYCKIQNAQSRQNLINNG